MSDAPTIFERIFSEQGGALALFGMLGGSVRSATLKTTWREGLRVVFIGGACSFGFGELGAYIITPFVGSLPHDVSTALGFMCSAAFIIGLIGVTIAEKFVFGRKPTVDHPNV